LIERNESCVFNHRARVAAPKAMALANRAEAPARMVKLSVEG